MKWVRDNTWVLILVLGVVYFVWLRPARGPKPDDMKAIIERHRAELAARQSRLDAEVARIQTDASLRMLRSVGNAYREHLAREKTPPQAVDFEELLDVWRSHRDDQPFEIVWGVDLTRLPDGGTGRRLAWEKTGAADGSRCVLLADGKTAKVVAPPEFEALPTAAPAGR
jgi:hypothetical protein